MNILEKFMVVLDTKMPEPTLFGWFHIMWLAIMILGTVFVCLKCKNFSDKQFRLFLLISCFVLILLEILKQLVHSFDIESGTWDYAWKQFPFQFCSTPMYIGLIIALIKDGKIRDSLCSFLGTFGLFAGLIVMVYPTTVLSDVIFRSTQSLLHHCTMVIMGALIWTTKKAKVEHKTILKGMAVFAVLVITAFVMNIIFHISGGTDSFNMFYIGPYSKCDLPVLNNIGQALDLARQTIHIGNFIFLLIYIVGFTLAAYIILLVVMLVHKLIKKQKERISHD